MHKRMERSAGGAAHGEGESGAQAGKRTLTEGLVQRKAAPSTPPVQLKPSDEPRQDQADPFDFSFAKEKEAAAGDAPPPMTTPTKKQVTNFGTFVASTYHPLTARGQQVGCEIVLRFEPSKKANATQIAMVQIARTINEGKVLDNATATEDGREIGEDDADKGFDSPVLGTDEGFGIDQGLHEENPLYAVSGAPRKDDGKLSSGKTRSKVRKATKKEKAKLKKDTDIVDGTHAGAGSHGYSFTKDDEWKHGAAILHDAPRYQLRGANAEQLFETTALAIAGKQEGTYYGSVQWGWRTDADGKFTLLPLTLVSKGDPSAAFVKAAEKWNRGKTDGRENIDLPIPGEDPDDWQP